MHVISSSNWQTKFYCDIVRCVWRPVNAASLCSTWSSLCIFLSFSYELFCGASILRRFAKKFSQTEFTFHRLQVNFHIIIIYVNFPFKQTSSILFASTASAWRVMTLVLGDASLPAPPPPRTVTTFNTMYYNTHSLYRPEFIIFFFSLFFPLFSLLSIQMEKKPAISSLNLSFVRCARFIH